jgi:chromosome segregation ATPase
MLKLKKRLFLFLFLFLLSLPGFSQDIFLTESEYQELMNIIRTSKRNSEQQQNLITELRETLAAQEEELKKALNSLELSEGDLTELRASLSRIRTYLDGLNEYCKALESENISLKSKNNGLKIGIGISGGATAVMLIVLLIMFL